MRWAAAALARRLLLIRLLVHRHARLGVEELLQEGQLAALRRRRACLERDDATVSQAEMLEVCDLAVLVEIDRQNRARFYDRREERHGLLDARDIVPGVTRPQGRETGRRRRVAQALLDACLGVGSDADLGFQRRVGQIAALIDDRGAA